MCGATLSSEPSSAETLLPRYKNCNTSSMFSPLMQIGRVRRSVILRTLVSLVFIFRPTLLSYFSKFRAILDMVLDSTKQISSGYSRCLSKDDIVGPSVSTLFSQYMWLPFAPWWFIARQPYQLQPPPHEKLCRKREENVSVTRCNPGGPCFPLEIY